MNLVSLKSAKDKDYFENLYLSAFPKDERIEVDKLYDLYKESLIDIILISKNNNEIGFAVIYLNENIHLLSYFAIDPDQRSKGYGSESLKLIKKTYDDLIIEIESTDFKDADDYLIRNKRKAFYIRNGFDVIDAYVNYFGIEMELMSTTKDAGIDDYFDTYYDIFDEEYIVENIKIIE